MNVYMHLQEYGKMTCKKLELSYNKLLYSDFRNTENGGYMARAFEDGMLNGIYTPQEARMYLGKGVELNWLEMSWTELFCNDWLEMKQAELNLLEMNWTDWKWVELNELNGKPNLNGKKP